MTAESKEPHDLPADATGMAGTAKRHQAADRRLAILATLVPPLGAATALGSLLLGLEIGPVEIGLTVSLYAATTLGLEVGYHRLLAHHSFRTSDSMRGLLAVLGCMAFQGPPIWWAAIHRRHHRFADTDLDPHSARSRGAGFRGRVRGMVHAHWGWLFDPERARPAGWESTVRDLYRDPVIFKIHMNYGRWLVIGLVIPAVLCAVLTSRIEGLLTGFLWAGLFRVFLADTAIRTINSVAHGFGHQAFETGDLSRNNPWLSLYSFGASWHNNHHANPRSATTRLKWWQVDLSGLFIRTLEIFGLAWSVQAVASGRESEASAPKTRFEEPTQQLE